MGKVKMKSVCYTFFVLILVFSKSVFASEQHDIEALKALDQSYATEWIEGDTEGVLSLFTEDATLVPHHGDAPIKGKQAIREFWFNPAYPPTVIAEWKRQASEIFIQGDIGVVRGRARLVWEYDGTRTTIPDSNYVLIAVRKEMQWCILMLTWNDDPRQWIQEPTA